MSTLKNIYKVTKEQYEALQSGETITINGTDYTYDNTALYLVEDNTTGIIDIADQYVRIWDLDTGIYRLTYSGTKYIYYYGATNTSYTTNSVVDKPIIYVNSYSSDSSEYRIWVSFTANEGTSGRIISGYTTATYGSINYKTISSLLTTGQVRNDLTYNTNNQSYVLSAYQGYLLDQRLQAVEQNGSSGSQLYLHSCRLYHYNGPAIDREIYFDIYSMTETSYTLQELMTWWQEKEVEVHQNIIINAYGAAIIDGEIVQFSRISFGTNSIQAYTPYSLGTSGGSPSLVANYLSVFQSTDNFVDTVITL